MGIKYQYYYINCFVVFLLSFNSIWCQNDSVNWINHIVSKGETSYGIAKKYKIDLNYFFNINPYATNGINKGDTLKIPTISHYINSIKKKSDSSFYKSHIVLNGETLWSIAKFYSVKVDDIKSLNRLNNNELNPSQLLYIPNSYSDTINIVNPIFRNPTHPLLETCDTLIIHKVKKKETLYGISNKYNISIDKLLKFNDNIRDKGLQKDQMLRVIKKVKNCSQDTALMNEKLLNLKYKKLDSKNLNVSVILPLNLEVFDTISKNCTDPSLCPLPINTLKSLKILNGYMLAFEKLKYKGYNLEISIFDSKNDTLQTKTIIRDSNFQKSNLILGPIIPKNIKLVRTFSRSNNVSLITYSDIPNKALFKFPNMFKFYPSNATQIKTLAYYFKESKENYNYIILSNKESSKSLSYAKVFVESFNDTLILEDSTLIFDSLKYSVVSRGDDFKSIESQLSLTDTNVFIIADTDIPFMTFVFNKLIEFSNSHDIYNYDFIIAGYEELILLNTIDDLYKNKFNLHFVSKGLIDFQSENVANFISDFQKLHGMNPDEVSVKAFDLVLSIFNHRYPHLNSSTTKYKGLYNNVDFKKIGDDSGYENKSVKIYRFKNYNTQQIPIN